MIFFFISFTVTIILGFLRWPAWRVGIVNVFLLPIISSIPDLIDYKHHDYILYSIPIDVMRFSIPLFLVGFFGSWMGTKIAGKEENIAKSKQEKNKELIKKLPIIVAIVLFFAGLAWLTSYIFSPYKTWKEEVALNDGRVIVVEQKRRMEGQIGREAWLTISLPDISSQPIVWHENLAPLVLNINDGHLFVVAHAPTSLEQRQYGIVKPAYYAFEWSNGVFVRIPFEKIPPKIYTTNLLIDFFPKHGESFVDIDIKENLRHGSPPTPLDLLRLDPNLGCYC